MTALCQNPTCRRPDDTRPPRQTMPSSPVCEACEDRAWQQLQDVARLWPQTVHALTHHSPSNVGPVDGTKPVGLDLNPRAVEARDQITHDLQALTANLRDAGRITTTPRHDDIPAMAHTIGTHITWFTHHTDHDYAVAVVEQITEAARACRWLSAPQPTRWHNTGIPCAEHATDDQGARVPCPGTYRARLTDTMTGLPNLECDQDPTHVLEPSGFRRLARTQQLVDLATGRSA